MRLPCPTEHQAGVMLTQYLELLQSTGKIVIFTHTAQETFTKSWGVKARNRASGVRPGIPDYVIVTPTTVLFIELKREHGGTVSPAQKLWIKALQGKRIVAAVAKGFDEAKVVVDKSIGLT